MKKINSILLAMMLSFLLLPTAALASTIDDVKYYVQNQYYGELPKNLDTLQTVNEIIKELDMYSHYMTKKEFDVYIKRIGGHTANESPPPTQPTLPTTITSKALYNNTGYLKITNFSPDIATDIEHHWKALEQNGAHRLIIDLRDNGGGYVESAEQLLGFFEGVKSSFHIYTRLGNERIATVPSEIRFPEETYLLINHQSASASEIVAVSLKDQKAATLVGQTSYGKGTIQTFFPLGEDGVNGVLKLTTAQFKGPAGTLVNKIGVSPNIETPMGKELTETHRVILEKMLNKEYSRKLNPTIITNPNATIRINLQFKMNFKETETSNRVELVQLGGGAVPITVSQSEDYSVIAIKPQQPLDPNAEYIAILRPEIKQLNGKRTKAGVHTTVTVATKNK